MGWWFCIEYFNPHSHKGSDVVVMSNKTIKNISIHTPTKGATCVYKDPASLYINFNPHSHKGSDLADAMIDTWFFSISIHTPTKGATGVTGVCLQDGTISIHTPTKGAT